MTISDKDTRAANSPQPPAQPRTTGLRCGTRRPARTLLTRLARLGHWYRRDFTFAFGAGQIGSTSSPPGPSQTLSQTEAHDAVRAAFTRWSTATNMAGQPIQLRFHEVGLDEDPDAIVEWVPPKHDAQTREQVGGQWTFADEGDMSAGVDGPDDDGAGAHADFPPRSVGGAAGNDYKEPPIPIHFNDDNPVAWSADSVEAYALHEIGHMLGLEHPEEVKPLPPGEQAVMSDVTPTLHVLQPNDRASIDELYGAPGPERFNWIWMKGTFPRSALHGLTRDELNHQIEDVQEPAGFHVARVGAYVVAGEPLFTAIVEQGGVADRHYATNRTRANFDSVHADYDGQGYRLIDVNNFIDAQGVVRFNGVWAKDLVDGRTFVGIGLAKLSAELTKAGNDGYRPILINGYETDDEQLWNALFVKQGALGEPRDWEAHVNKSAEDFDAKYAALGEEFDPTYFHTRVLDGGSGERWTGIWEKIGVPSREGYGWAERDFLRRTDLYEQEIEGLQPWDLNAFVLPSTSTTTTTLASLQQPPTGRHNVVLGLAVDDTRVYATRYHQLIEPPHTSERAGVLVVLDRQELRPVPELPQVPGFQRGVPVGFLPRSVALNPTSGKIYVVNYGVQSYSLTVIDATSLEVLRTIKLGQAPHQVAVNTKLNRVYVTNPFQSRIHVFDSATDEPLEPIVWGRGFGGMAVDEARNMLYVVIANRSFPPFANGLLPIVDGPGVREILPLVAINPIGIDSNDVVFDPFMDRLYVSNQGNIGAAPPSITVFHRPSLSILATVNVAGPPRQIAFNSAAHEIYVTTDSGHVQVVDAFSLTPTRTIPTGTLPWGLAAAPGTARQIFVGDRLDGSVRRIS